MLQTVNASSENDFDNPLGLLSDCHRRIEKFLERVICICERGGEGELDAEQRETLETALRYFRQAAPLHTADEEILLFPRLRERAESGSEKARQALAVMELLEAEHNVADENHAVIDKLGTRWLNASTRNIVEVKRLQIEARMLREFYAAHIAMEDDELFPLAEQVLSGDAVESIGREMAARRGLDFDNLPPAGSRCAARKAIAAK